MRVDLRDGMWADLRERISHGQDKEIIRAKRRVSDGGDVVDEYVPVMLRVFVRDWTVKDLDGLPITLADADAFDRAPDDVIDVLFPHTVALHKNVAPDERYARLIGRLLTGQKVFEREISELPEPETFRDALTLATTELRWSPKDLDETDALLLALIEKFRNAEKG